jgi:hypothetical protein
MRGQPPVHFLLPLSLVGLNYGSAQDGLPLPVYRPGVSPVSECCRFARAVLHIRGVSVIKRRRCREDAEDKPGSAAGERACAF